jgi:hypothetical protein
VKIRNLNLLFDRDNPPHFLDFNFVEFYTKEMVLAGVKNVTNLILQYFPNVPVYPALGIAEHQIQN